jgi:hypothetical protein
VRNSPAVLTAFKGEFDRLKYQVGNSAVTAPRFVADELERFERIGFRSYISKDIHSRVVHIQKSRPTADPQKLAALLSKAIEIDDQNTDAHQLLLRVAPAAVIDGYAVRAQQAVRQQLSVVDAPRPEQSVSPATTPPVPAPPSSVSTAPSVSSMSPVAPTTQQHTIPTPAHLKPQPISAVPGIAASGTTRRPPSTPRPAPTLPNRPSVSSVPSAGPSVTPTSKPAAIPVSSPTPAINTSISIPDSQRTAALYENLQLVFALDYSNSMESRGQGHNGYKLYSTGKSSR